jgi:hypothetical protein
MNGVSGSPGERVVSGATIIRNLEMIDKRRDLER